MAARELDVPLSQIEIDPDNVRSAYDADMVRGLRSALETDGEYINEPVVYAIGPNRYRVKHGSTRVLAARGVVDRLRVRLVDSPENESSKLLSQMSENLLQGSLSPVDVGNALKRLRDADGRERSLSQIVGALRAVGIQRTKQWVSRHLALTELDPEVQRLLKEGAIHGELAYHLRSLPPQEQVSWAHRIKDEGLTLAQIRQLLGEGTDDSPDSAEYIHRELADRFSDAADDADAARSGARRAPADRRRRHGDAKSRWMLLPVVVEQTDQRKMRPLQAGDWAQSASDIQLQLAKEALFMGGFTAQRAMHLADQALAESEEASDDVMMALNSVKRLLEHPAQLKPGSALAELMLMRLRCINRNLQAKD